MKRLLSLFLAFTLMLQAWAVVIGSGTCGTNLTWELDEQGVLTISGTGSMTSYTYSFSNNVTNAPWGKYYESIKTVIVNDGVTSISQYAFQGCSSLTSITLPAGLTSISVWTFNDCSSLTSITLPAGLTSIGMGAFADCSSLTSINLPASVTRIGEYAFGGCSRLTKLYLDSPLKLSEISYNTSSGHPFYGSGGGDVFCNNQLISEITIPADKTNLSEYTFKNWNNIIEKITLEATTVGTPGELGVENLKGSPLIIVPSSAYQDYLTSSAWQSFASRITTADYLQQISVNVKATNQGSGVQNEVGAINANRVTNLKVNGSINSYDFMVFRTKMPCLRQLDLSEATIEDCSYEYYEGFHSMANVWGRHILEGTSIREVKLPNNLKKVSDYAFNGCAYLESVSFGDELTSIGNYAFQNCTRLADAIIPTSVEEIGNYAFYQDAVLPNQTFSTMNVKKIGNYAFYGCNCLMEVVLPEGLTSLGTYSFNRCSALGYVSLPNSLSVIPNYAFEYCQNLEILDFGANISTINAYAFRGCSKLESVTFPGKISKICNNAFNGCTSLTELQIPSSIKQIEDNAFAGCNAIKNIYVEPALPTPIAQTTFSSVCYSTATLHYPQQSKDEYYWHTVWGKFLNQEWLPQDFAFEFIFLDADKTLNEGTGTWSGDPEIEIGNAGGLIVEDGIGQTSDKVTIGSNGDNTGSVIASEGGLTANELAVNINIVGNQWYFFCFPFDVPLDLVSFDGDYVWRLYDTKARAASGDGWKNVTGTKLHKGKGYIFQGSKNGTLSIAISNPLFAIGNPVTVLETGESSKANDASWNLIGNPYLSYYGLGDLATTDFTAPVTRWNSSKKTYEAVSPVDDPDVQLHPFEAFFVQKPNGNETLDFVAEGQATLTQSKDKALAAQRRMAQRRAAGEDTDRQLINLTVAADDEICDKTRVVLNAASKMDYEQGCDAAKFYSSSAQAQLYSFDPQGVQYAINERPWGTNTIRLGFVAAAKGTFTISAPRQDVEVRLVDKQENHTHDLCQGSYIFNSNAGTFNDRFELIVVQPESLQGIDLEAAKTGAECYNVAGQRIANEDVVGVSIEKNDKQTHKVIRR